MNYYDCMLSINCNGEQLHEIYEFIKNDEKKFDLHKYEAIPAEMESSLGSYFWRMCENLRFCYYECAFRVERTLDSFDIQACSYAIQRLSEYFPDAAFLYSYEDQDMGICGAEEYQRGSLIYRMIGERQEIFDDECESMIDEGIFPDENTFEDVEVVTGRIGEWKVGKVYSRAQLEEGWIREFQGNVQYIGDGPTIAWYRWSI